MHFYGGANYFFRNIVFMHDGYSFAFFATSAFIIQVKLDCMFSFFHKIFNTTEKVRGFVFSTLLILVVYQNPDNLQFKSFFSRE